MTCSRLDTLASTASKFSWNCKQSKKISSTKSLQKTKNKILLYQPKKNSLQKTHNIQSLTISVYISRYIHLYKLWRWERGRDGNWELGESILGKREIGDRPRDLGRRSESSQRRLTWIRLWTTGILLSSFLLLFCSKVEIWIRKKNSCPVGLVLEVEKNFFFRAVNILYGDQFRA